MGVKCLKGTVGLLQVTLYVHIGMSWFTKVPFKTFLRGSTKVFQIFKLFILNIWFSHTIIYANNDRFKTIFLGFVRHGAMEGHLKSASLSACLHLFFKSFYTLPFIYDGVSLFSCLIIYNSQLRFLLQQW